MARSSRRIDDPLWKSILEQTFSHFLRFIFPNADDVFDFRKPFDYLDKEFESLFPPEANGKGVRYVDKLVKIFLKNGGEQFILCHIEVQSSKGKGDLAERMFRYFYMIADRYKVPVTAIAILADENKNYRPKVYVQDFMGTKLHYEFNSYKILVQDESALRSNPNPFAVVVLTALLAITRRNADDDELKNIKHSLYDEMMARKMNRYSRQGIYDFLSHYIRFQNKENFYIFEKEVEIKLGRSNIMGTREYLLDKAQREGMEKGERSKAIAIARELKKEGLSIEFIAKTTKLSIEEIEKLK